MQVVEKFIFTRSLRLYVSLASGNKSFLASPILVTSHFVPVGVKSQVVNLITKSSHKSQKLPKSQDSTLQVRHLYLSHEPQYIDLVKFLCLTFYFFEFILKMLAIRSFLLTFLV